MVSSFGEEWKVYAIRVTRVNRFDVDRFPPIPYILGMNVARAIVLKFGGTRPLADMLGHAHTTTVQGWIARSQIPVRQIPIVLEVARRVGVELTLEDFFPSQGRQSA